MPIGSTRAFKRHAPLPGPHPCANQGHQGRYPMHIHSQHQNALIYCTDANALENALFSASHAALLNPDRNFDILICSLTPLTLPPYFRDLGIIPVHLDLEDRLADADLRLRHLPLTSYLRLWLPEQFA